MSRPVAPAPPPAAASPVTTERTRAPSRRQHSHAHRNSGRGHAAPQQQASRSEVSSITRVEEVRGRVCEMGRDQAGCRLLQKWLEDDEPGALSTIFKEVADALPVLMVDGASSTILKCHNISDVTVCSLWELLVPKIGGELLPCAAVGAGEARSPASSK